MSDEIKAYKIVSLDKLNQVASYNKWMPNKIERVRIEFGEFTINSLMVNECDACDYAMTPNNVDMKLGHAKHVVCPPESKIVTLMPGDKHYKF